MVTRLYTLGKAAGFRGLFAGLGPRMIMTVYTSHDDADSRPFWCLDSLRFMRILRRLLEHRHQLRFIRVEIILLREVCIDLYRLFCVLWLLIS
jgi:hypothetical protein